MLDGGPGGTRGRSCFQKLPTKTTPCTITASQSKLQRPREITKSGTHVVRIRGRPGRVEDSPRPSVSLSELTRRKAGCSGHGAQGFLRKTQLFQEGFCPPCLPPGQAAPPPERRGQSRPNIASGESLRLCRWKAWLRVWTRSLKARVTGDIAHPVQAPARNIDARSGQSPRGRTAPQRSDGGRLEVRWSSGLSAPTFTATHTSF